MAGKGRIENLKNFPKGKSGNPKGRPRKIPQLDTLLAELFGEDEKGQSDARKLLQTLKTGALSGKLNATRFQTAERLADRLWGKAKSNDTLNVKLLNAKEIAEGDEKAKKILEEYNLLSRVKKSE